ncbi:uncharacterized protein LY89DRAFT_684748 [Mollisia scopiformis]|uniref:WW domain-containing protein n=1 Tax=Mollisia scopiformis TaxID=149040 RepID=A0A194XCC5_MOLSC|nr:uncharacterized protein LY89DRAFT_684748 [Mollisia scopiformis]KUJ17820.1 hypothetical protein LY89DRAFT_684748 [Mollisia scopiformis]
MASRRDQIREDRRSASPRAETEPTSSKDKSPIDARDDHGEDERVSSPEDDDRDEGEASSVEDEGRVITTEKDAEWLEKHNATSELSGADGSAEAPPLPEEAIPPLPSEAPPATEPDDGWAPVWEESAQAFYFYNRFTHATQWTNPRVPEAGPPGVDPAPVPAETTPAPATSGYNPAIHGDYDPTAWYAQPAAPEPAAQPIDPSAQYAASAAFNRFTGRFQNAELTPENFNDENKSKRQMNAFFDVDAAANSHDGRSLKAERSGKKLSKTELKQFKEKRKAKKEEKRRAWLRD